MEKEIKKRKCPFCSKPITNSVRALKRHLEEHEVELEEEIQFCEIDLERIRKYYRKYI